MIAFVKGILEYSVPGKVVIDVNGIGINVIVCDADRAELLIEGNEVIQSINRSKRRGP